MNRTLMALAAALVVVAAPAQAITYAWSGNTTGAPTFDRPFFDFSGLSEDGEDVRYQTLPFRVTVAGTYDFLSVAAGWDNFLLLYSPSFSPGSPLDNGIVANDVRGPQSPCCTAGFVRNLVAGVTYIAVTTGYGSTDFGAYANTIDGPGNVVVVPEPATALLLALGVCGLFGRQAFRNPRLRRLASK